MPQQQTPQQKYQQNTYRYNLAGAPERAKMSNSFEHLTGSPREIKLMYEKLSELIREAGGKVHGSQRGLDAERMLDILVYYEVPELSKLGVQAAFNKYATMEMNE